MDVCSNFSLSRLIYVYFILFTLFLFFLLYIIIFFIFLFVLCNLLFPYLLKKDVNHKIDYSLFG